MRGRSAHRGSNGRTTRRAVGEVEHAAVRVAQSDADGVVAEAANPNGTVGNVAGVCNTAGNVFGLMPHPEHAVEARIGGEDGRLLLGSLVDAVAGARA